MSGSYTSSGVVIDGTLAVVSGGQVWEATLIENSWFALSGGLEIASAGLAEDTTITYGNLTVDSGGRVQGVSVTGSGGYVVVQSGGVASGVTVDTTEGVGIINLSGGSTLVGTKLDNGWINAGNPNGGRVLANLTDTVVDGGGISGNAARLTDTLIESGVVYLFNGVMSETVVDGTGSAYTDNGSLIDTTIEGGGAVEVDDGGIASGVVVSSGGTFIVDNGSVVTGVHITSGGVVYAANQASLAFDLDAGGIVDFVDLTYGDDEILSVSNGVLEISEPGAVVSATLEGDAADGHFRLSDDGNGGTDVTLVADGTPCYCRGTLIGTDRGEVAVEDLVIGDRVRTLCRGLRPIRWIGRRSYSGRFAAGNRDVLPVMFRAGCLGDGLPRRDLFVSPLHAMFLDGVLVPASGLINGTSIVQVEAMDEVAYFHIELDSHDVILAEGAPSETFVDDDSRGMFHNAAEFARLYPDLAAEPARYCAPRIEDGVELEAIRGRLAGLTTPAPRSEATLSGYLDTVSRAQLTGWARAEGTDVPVALQVLDRGVVIGEVVADRPRPDIGIACGFAFDVPGGLSPLERHLIEVRRRDDRALLRNAPWMLDAAAPAVPTTVPTTAPLPVAPAPLVGHLDQCGRARVSGWAFSPDTPDAPVPLQLVVNGEVAAAIVANVPRPDVPLVGACPRLRCGFDIMLSVPLAPFARHVVELRREHDGARLGQPTVIEPVDACDPEFERAVRQAIASADATRQEHVLSFLLGQVETLRQTRAETDTGCAERRLERSRARRGLAIPRARPSRVLVVDSRHPDPRRDAGSVAVLSHMRALQALGYEVSFAASAEMADDRPRHPLGTGVSVLSAPVYHSVEEVLRRQADSFDLVYLHRCDNAARYLSLVRLHQRRARVVYSLADLHALRLRRQAEVEERPELLAQAECHRRLEARAMREADVLLTHSTEEAALIGRDLPGVNVHVVPWSVSVRPPARRLSRARSGVLFFGNYAHAPNLDAALWLVEEIMPRVWDRDPAIHCLLAGAEMPARLRALAGGRVEVLGQVDDLDALFGGVRLSVAPLRFGAGAKGKVIESLAAGLPCVMTPIAAEGLGLPDTLRELIADGAGPFAERIVRLHRRRAGHAALVRAGRAYTSDVWSEAAEIRALGEALRVPVANVTRRSA